MMVTFISQCEKKAISKTRRVLDSFANRIGDYTWQTVITDEGLQAVKKLLKKSASKNTAVSCHWIRSRSRSELVWIVGSRDRFNSEGYVPVHYTKKDIIKQSWEDDWHYLPLIKSLTGIAGLFHDFGKANDFFQGKLLKKENIGDPIRHEWVSVLFFVSFINNRSDEEWIERLTNGEISLINKIEAMINIKSPFKILSPLASLIVWLILSHHRLPDLLEKRYEDNKANDFKKLLGIIQKSWNYENTYVGNEINLCFKFSKGLPSDSETWLREIKKAARKLKETIPLFEKTLADDTWRLILLFSRLSLVLGDHYYSSLDSDEKWKSKLELFANTYKNDNGKKVYKQYLDEHLIGVTKKALRTAHLLPAFESKDEELQSVYDLKILKQKSPFKYKWQDKAVNRIIKWREEAEDTLNKDHFGFFAVNMASTGKGKTFANAKIMRALSPNEDSLRYILALGLRTLTLQTGDEYRDRIKLLDDDLAVIIGSKAVQDLHEKNNNAKEDYSESESLFDNEIKYDFEIPEGELKTVIQKSKHRKLLYAPVLACTIDHIMPATESTRGGRQILPILRLMSSDLVIDEIDDFSGDDLVAIGRLVHLAGMLGRKVMISSATIPPDLAEGYFNCYKEGWELFAKLRGKNPNIGCAWIDEFSTFTEEVISGEGSILHYRKYHTDFINKRVSNLKKQPVKRKVDIKYLNKNEIVNKNNEDFYFGKIKEAVEEKHRGHCYVDDLSGINVSFGVVRIANINPCVRITRYLLNAEWDDDTEIRAMPYHSRQVLLMRSEQEKHLDAVLKRNKKSPFENPLIRKHIENSKKKNLIFVLVATPVEEVGRDHDFDWAVVEPSSFRSVIQLAGRVLRHRELDKDIENPNITIMQYNIKGFNGEKIAFKWPGYESDANPLETHDVVKLLDIKSLDEVLDATYRISRNKELKPESNLVDLEHYTINKLLTNYNMQGAKFLQGWLQGYWWLTALPQRWTRFRSSSPSTSIFLIPGVENLQFKVKDPRSGELIKQERQLSIEHDESLTEKEEKFLWIKRDYKELLEIIGDKNIEKSAVKYGEINIPTDQSEFIYSSQFGMIRKK